MAGEMELENYSYALQSFLSTKTDEIEWAQEFIRILQVSNI